MIASFGILCPGDLSDFGSGSLLFFHNLIFFPSYLPE